MAVVDIRTPPSLPTLRKLRALRGGGECPQTSIPSCVGTSPTKFPLGADGVIDFETSGIQEKRTCSPDDLFFGQAGLAKQQVGRQAG